ncbi:AEC family transporter [Rhodalgimonas zhirmunskyi]|uniref:AEC family transporter n=1 Tax=Rhodalgimonas zhirmunskyi TaxID=2964767 RepID=A0AAJ1X550_9RHOB|nr:AEC family transporter [Rhodoalgimonas zhirmunskyi]MDQ2094913.1 AEC family transporter [Rhodoalgimonas zhirmunskyi]
MEALLEVVLPVFLVIGFGYLAVWKGFFSDEGVDGLMKFTQNFAVPALLFAAISRLDLGEAFNFNLILSFYTGSITSFTVGLLGARFIFRRDWEETVAIAFCCLFANSLMLGLPMTEQAYGSDALGPNYAIVALHSPFCYGLGITVMEIVRARGQSMAKLPATVAKAMFRNALIIGIGLGFVVNFSDVELPLVITHAVDLLVRSALPVALFGMGGVMARYKPEGDGKVIAMIVLSSLILHPAVVWFMGRSLHLTQGEFRSAVLTASMAPGINSYVFASLYGKARRAAASGVLIGTAVSVLTVWLWLAILP